MVFLDRSGSIPPRPTNPATYWQACLGRYGTMPWSPGISQRVHRHFLCWISHIDQGIMPLMLLTRALIPGTDPSLFLPRACTALSQQTKPF